MNIIPFNFESKEIRVVEINNEPWFVAKDVAEALEYVWKGSASISHIPDEWRGVYSVQTPSGVQEMSCLSEQGLYFFVNRSDKPKALPFQKWVAGNVMPSIRKNGGYIAGQETDDPELIMAKALQVAQNVIDRKTLELQQAKQIIEIQAPKVEFVNKFIQATSGNMTFRDTAKILKINEREFRAFLFDKKIMYRLSGDWVPFQQHIDAGRFEIKAGLIEHEDNSHAFKQSKFTPKGIEWVAGEYAKHQASKALQEAEVA